MPLLRVSQTAARTLLVVAALALPAHAQSQPDAARKTKSTTNVPAFACDEQRAVGLVEEQVAAARGFEKPVAQIAVMTRAADLLWAYREDTARSIFAEAYELAAKYYRQKGEEQRAEGAGLLIRMPDQRFVVLRAIARHDAEWSRRLAEEAADESRRASEKEAEAARGSEEPGEKLIDLAESLLPVNQSVATGLARASFAYPLTSQHAQFFFDLAQKDRAAADALALEAINAYGVRGTAEDLSYLSVYVFNLRRNISYVRTWTVYQPPEGFDAGAALREAFVKAVLARAELILKTPDQFSADKDANRWETSQILSALVSLEPLVARALPAYSERLAALRASVQASVSDRARAASDDYMQSLEDWKKYGNFDAQLEKAEGETNPDRKDFAYASAASQAKTLEQLDRAESLVEKIADANARRQLLDWLNFSRAQQLVKDGRLDEAKRAADRVGELDQRALLYFVIAREGLKRLSDRARAYELLDDVLATASKAPLTDVRARAQLGVAHLYAEFDPLRALEVVGEAVKTVNQLKDPNLASPSIIRRIEGKTFGIYAGNFVPGFSLENTFQEAGAKDFEGALLAARNLADPQLRATAVTGLAAHCLEESAKKKATPKRPATKQQTMTKP